MFQTKTAGGQQTGKERLRVDNPDSGYEKEADFVSKQGMNGDQVMGGSGGPKGQVMGGTNGNGMTAGAEVEEQLQSTKGSGEKLTQSERKLANGQAPEALDEVRVHTDSRAAEMSKKLGAKAFTYGKDIYVGLGFYDTNTSDGKQLLSHELAHTGQSGWGAPMIRRAPLTTWGGDWTASPYKLYSDPLMNGGKPCGTEMHIKFKANDNVDSTHIGLVQTSQAIHNNKPDYIGEQERKDRAVTSGIKNNVFKRNDAGFHIDQHPGFGNPMYATGQANKGEGLGSTTRDPDWGIHGWHNYKNGTLHHLDAELKDTPAFDPITPGDETTFETAALGMYGNQKMMYYGSVKWGWKADSTGKVTKKPFEIASMGSPTSTFNVAAKKWNAQTFTDPVSGDVIKNIYLPYDKVQVTTGESTTLHSSPTTCEACSELPKETRIVVIKKERTQEEIDSGMVEVRVADGPLVGETGWVVEGSYTEERAYQRNKEKKK